MSQIDLPPNSSKPFEKEYYPRAAPIMVGVTLVLFLAMMLLLADRWFNMAEPNGFILIQGSKQFDGAEITIMDATGDAESHGILKDTNDYRMRFPLPQGTYRVAITLGDKIIVKQAVGLEEGNGMVFKLDRDAATEPVTD